MNTNHLDIIQAPTVSDSEKLNRRVFLDRSMRLAALAALAGLGGCGVDTGTGPSASEPVTVLLSDYPGLSTPGAVERISSSGRPLALVNVGGGTFVAVSLRCPHQGTTVRWNGSTFVCPNHGARFDADGSWRGGQFTSNLLAYPTTYDAAAGIVTIAPRA